MPLNFSRIFLSMRHRLRAWALVLAFCFALSGSCLAAESPFRTQEGFVRWTTHYYLAPDSQKIPGALSYYCNSMMFAREDTRMPMAAFFSAVFQGNPVAMQQTYDEIALRGTDDAKIFLLNVLWLVNNSASQSLLQEAKRQWTFKAAQKVFAKMGERKPQNVFLAPITDPVQLDMLWARFSATGDPACVRKIISAALEKQEGSSFNMLIGGAASWSLASNARQHDRVLAICRDERIKSSGPTKELLEQIIHSSNAENASKNRF